jgi:hypothetical protein
MLDSSHTYQLWRYPDPLALYRGVMTELDKPENETLKRCVETGSIAYTDVPGILLDRQITGNKPLYKLWERSC